MNRRSAVPGTVPLGATVRDAVRSIEETRRTIAVVVDDDGRLFGTVSDGDIRRAILGGLDLSGPIAQATNRAPVTGSVSSSSTELLQLLRRHNLEALPVVDAGNVVVRVLHIGDLQGVAAPSGGAERYSAAVVMAGGEGRRLLPLTQDRPKPMLDVGGQPVIERLVRSLARAHISRIYIATNYLSHLIEEHFGDGAEFDVDIRYLRESKFMGTAGALSLLPERPKAPLLVVNGDVLTTSDYRSLLAYHEEHQALVTVGATEYRVEIPFGVLRNEGPRVVAIEEKPSQRFLCNAGIYVLAPRAIDLVTAESRVDMTDLIEQAMAKEEKVVVFPIHEYWADIGNRADLDRARAEIDLMERGRG